MPDPDRWQRRLGELIATHKVPGASVAVLCGGGDEVVELAAGVTNRRTGVEVTTDTVFQIGSISKVWTATLVMMLVDDGVLELDTPVRAYLPEFKVADPYVTDHVTLRHLLSHTSGIGGDHLVDAGRGDDCLERYVAACAELGQDHELGETMSYCNTGFSVAGRVIEVVTGQGWDQVMRERLFRPLGLTYAGTLPEEALLHRAALGHVGPPGQEPAPAPVWGMPRAAGPAGLIHTTPAEVIAFARLHLADGRGPDGTQLLSPASAKAMRESQVAVPNPYSCTAWGLGWMLFDWGGHALFGHDGATLGQGATLRVLPEQQLALAAVVNGGAAVDFFQALATELFDELAGVPVPVLPPPAPAPEPGAGPDLSAYEGAYERLHVSADVRRAAGGLEATITYHGPLAKLLPPGQHVRTVPLAPVDAALFIATEEHVGPRPLVFFDFEGTTPWRLHFDGRAMTKKC
jgi:CubicO group peptidase (beta-lactamase class C family)